MSHNPNQQTLTEPFKVGVVQATPVFLNLGATLAKAIDLIRQAAKEGARLVVFPEAFLPSYPDWIWAIPAGEEQLLGQLHAELLANSVSVPDATTETLCSVAREHGIHVVMGVNERNSEASGGSLYNTILYIDDEGQLLGKHRKLVPTGGERLVWAQGNGSTLAAYDTKLGKLGGLICWENYMPLARYAMYAWGTQIYVAPTWDRGQPWLSTMRHIAKEGQVYVLGCSIVMRTADIPDTYDFKRKYYAEADEWINVGDSVIVNPDGFFVAGPARQKEEILYAEIDPKQMQGPRWMLDVAGHYGRPDVFELIVHTDENPMLKRQ